MVLQPLQSLRQCPIIIDTSAIELKSRNRNTTNKKASWSRFSYQGGAK
jgi:hypothetical protein